jgi:hypothetical protein
VVFDCYYYYKAKWDGVCNVGVVLTGGFSAHVGVSFPLWQSYAGFQLIGYPSSMSIKTTDDEISPSLRSRIDLVKTDTLSDENVMMAGIGRNM